MRVRVREGGRVLGILENFLDFFFFFFFFLFAETNLLVPFF